MKQSRLEALKLAVMFGGEYDLVIPRAEQMAQFLEKGPNVEQPPQSTDKDQPEPTTDVAEGKENPKRQRRKRRY